MSGLGEKAPANWCPSILHHIEKTRFPIAPKAPDPFPCKGMVQHACQIEAAYHRIRTDQVETKKTMSTHHFLAHFQKCLWKGVNNVHPESMPILNQAISHRANQNEVFGILRNVGLLVHA